MEDKWNSLKETVEKWRGSDFENIYIIDTLDMVYNQILKLEAEELYSEVQKITDSSLVVKAASYEEAIRKFNKYHEIRNQCNRIVSEGSCTVDRGSMIFDKDLKRCYYKKDSIFGVHVYRLNNEERRHLAGT